MGGPAPTPGSVDPEAEETLKSPQPTPAWRGESPELQPRAHTPPQHNPRRPQPRGRGPAGQLRMEGRPGPPWVCSGCLFLPITEDATLDPARSHLVLRLEFWEWKSSMALKCVAMDTELNVQTDCPLNRSPILPAQGPGGPHKPLQMSLSGAWRRASVSPAAPSAPPAALLQLHSNTARDSPLPSDTCQSPSALPDAHRGTWFPDPTDVQSHPVRSHTRVQGHTRAAASPLTPPACRGVFPPHPPR